MPSRRYWRLRVVENHGNSFAGKGAVAVIDLRVSSGGSNLATTGNGTASASTEVVGFEASKAFDGNVNTYWQSGDAATANSQWITWDFGAGNEQDINYVALTDGNEAALSQLIKRWTLQHSSDGNNWTPWMYSTTNNPGNGNDTPTAWSWSSSMVPAATVVHTLPSLSLSAVRGGSVGFFTLAAPTILAYGGRSVNATLPGLLIESKSGNTAQMTFPGLSILATGKEWESALRATLAGPQLLAYGGGVVLASLPSLSFAGTATLTNVLRLSADMPAPSLLASGTTGGLASLSRELPGLQVNAAGGGYVSASLPGLRVTAAATAGGLATVIRTLAGLSIEASGRQQNYGRVNATLPGLGMTPVGRALLTLPGLSIVAMGKATVSVTYEAYAMNLMPGEGMPHQVTEYTNFGFNQIVRLGDDYYGVKANGLYLLGGDTDYATPTPAKIAWRVRTGLTNFGSRQKKMVRESFVHGRLGPSVTAKVSVQEGADATYPAQIQRGSSAQAHRIKYGKGLKAQFWAFELEDTNGSHMEIDGWHHEPAESERKV